MNLVWSVFEVPKATNEFWLKLTDVPTIYKILKSWHGIKQGSLRNNLVVLVSEYDRPKLFNEPSKLYQGYEDFKNLQLLI